MGSQIYQIDAELEGKKDELASAKFMLVQKNYVIQNTRKMLLDMFKDNEVNRQLVIQAFHINGDDFTRRLAEPIE